MPLWREKYHPEEWLSTPKRGRERDREEERGGEEGMLLGSSEKEREKGGRRMKGRRDREKATGIIYEWKYCPYHCRIPNNKCSTWHVIAQ